MAAAAGLQKAMCDCFAEQAIIEGRAVVFARHFARSGLLTAPEREFASDVLLVQEARHMHWAQSIAAWLGGADKAKLRGAIRRVAEMLRDDPASELQSIVWVNTHERFAMRTFGVYIAIVRRLLPREFAEEAATVVEEERTHKEWGCRLVARLRNDYPEWRRDIRSHQTIRGHDLHDLARRLQAIHDVVQQI